MESQHAIGPSRSFSLTSYSNSSVNSATPLFSHWSGTNGPAPGPHAAGRSVGCFTSLTASLSRFVDKMRSTISSAFSRPVMTPGSDYVDTSMHARRYEVRHAPFSSTEPMPGLASRSSSFDSPIDARIGKELQRAMAAEVKEAYENGQAMDPTHPQFEHEVTELAGEYADAVRKTLKKSLQGMWSNGAGIEKALHRHGADKATLAAQFETAIRDGVSSSHAGMSHRPLPSREQSSINSGSANGKGPSRDALTLANVDVEKLAGAVEQHLAGALRRSLDEQRDVWAAQVCKRFAKSVPWRDREPSQQLSQLARPMIANAARHHADAMRMQVRDQIRDITGRSPSRELVSTILDQHLYCSEHALVNRFQHAIDQYVKSEYPRQNKLICGSITKDGIGQALAASIDMALKRVSQQIGVDANTGQYMLYTPIDGSRTNQHKFEQYVQQVCEAPIDLLAQQYEVVARKNGLDPNLSDKGAQSLARNWLSARRDLFDRGDVEKQVRQIVEWRCEQLKRLGHEVYTPAKK